jgi:hypothetical protein
VTDPPAREVPLTRRSPAGQLRYLAGKLAEGGAGSAAGVAVALEILAFEMGPAARWEYMTIGQRDGWGPGTTLSRRDIGLLNDLGAEGWEVIPPWGMTFCLLRRPLPPAGNESGEVR